MTTIVRNKDVSHLMIGNREVGSGDAVWIDAGGHSLTEENLIFIEEIKESAIGKRFNARFKFGANFELLEATMYKLHPDAPFVTTGRMLDAMQTMMNGASDQLIPKEVAAPTPRPSFAPLTKNGRPMTEPQQRWSEYRTWSESHSMHEVRERMRIDPGYASFVNTNREREFEQGGDGRLVSETPQLSKDEAAGVAAKQSITLDKLRDWVAENYTTTPASRVRFLRSVANPYREEYERNFQTAIGAGLI